MKTIMSLTRKLGIFHLTLASVTGMIGSGWLFGVVGAGVMGHGIAAVFASSGYNVILSDVQDCFLSSAMEKMRWSL